MNDWRIHKEVELIKLTWSGPHGIQEVLDMKSHTDCGLYQIYGTHAIFGPDSLLYIGRTKKDGGFSSRLGSHKDVWIQWEPREVSVYLGRVPLNDRQAASDQQEDYTEWDRQIVLAERLLIYFCAPPYNESGLKAFWDKKDGDNLCVENYQTANLVLLNFAKRHRLPHVVTSLWEIEASPGLRQF